MSGAHRMNPALRYRLRLRYPQIAVISIKGPGKPGIRPDNSGPIGGILPGAGARNDVSGIIITFGLIGLKIPGNHNFNIFALMATITVETDMTTAPIYYLLS
jgi:hypothetical protein